MKNGKEFKQLGVSEKLKLSESLGAKVAKIMNIAREKANKILLPTGYGVNITVEFYKLEAPKQETKEQEVTNG